MSSNNGHPLTKMVKSTVPQLTSTMHKGQSGRIAVNWWFTGVSIENVWPGELALWDPGGGGRRPTSLPIFFHFHVVFGKKSCQIICFCTKLSGGIPCLGNPALSGY